MQTVAAQIELVLNLSSTNADAPKTSGSYL